MLALSTDPIFSSPYPEKASQFPMEALLVIPTQSSTRFDALVQKRIRLLQESK